MGRSPETVFGCAAADAYDPALHGSEPRAYLDRCFAERGAGLDDRSTHTAFTVRLAFINMERSLPPPDDRPRAVSGEIVVSDAYAG